jgi:hypothetical protein
MTRILNQTKEHGVLFPSGRARQDSFPIAIPAGEKFHSCRLTILDAYMGGDACIKSQPRAGTTGSGRVVVEWDGGPTSLIQYQVEAFSAPAADSPATATASVTSQMSDFVPSVNGFHFNNSFEAVPPFRLIGELRYGDASKGLCGGMVYAALDYFNAGLDLPRMPSQDLSTRYGSPLHGPIFDYLGQRLFHSFDIPDGVKTYIELMNPGFPDALRRGTLGLAPRSRAWRTVRQEWPIIKRRLDSGQACPLGLVCVETTDIRRLGENHQVLAYGYDLVGNDLTLFIYDPNWHDRDDITLKLNVGDPEHKVQVAYSDGRTVNSFFQTRYTFSRPPSDQPAPGRILLYEGEDFCGRCIDVVRSQPDLTLFKEGYFNDRTSSMTILGGNWSFYRDPHFGSPFSRRSTRIVVGPGTYARIADLGIQDNAISSLQQVADPVNYPV